MFTLFKKIYFDKFFRDSFLLFFLSQLGSLFHFLYQYLMSHTLTKSDYGLLNSLLSFYMILVIPVTTLQMVVSKYVSEYVARNQEQELKYFYSSSIRNLVFISVILFIILFFLQKKLALFFHIESSFVFLLLGVLVISNFFMYFGLGFLQGYQKFLLVGVCLSSAGILKWFGSYILPQIASFSIENILCVLWFASLLVLFPVFYSTKHLWVFPFGGKDSFKEKLSYAFPSLISYTILSSMLFIDLILVQHFLRGEEAGLYATAAILGKTVFYLALSVIMVMFPKVTENVALEKASFPYLLKALGFAVFVSGSMLSLFILFPEYILEFFGKKEAIAAAAYLQWYALAMFFMALLYVIVNYLIAIANFSFLKPLFAIVVLEILGMTFFHETPAQILTVLLTLLISIVFILFIGLTKWSRVQLKYGLLQE